MIVTMKSISSIYTSARSQLAYILLVPSFFLVFITLYQPHSITEFIAMNGERLTFNVTLLACIILGVMLCSRTMLCLTQRQRKMSRGSWVLWQVSEVVVASLFMALYMALMYHGEYPYFNVVGRCFYALAATDIYLYVILALVLGLMSAHEEDSKYDDSLMRFQDSQKQVKLIIAAQAVLYVEAQENYVLIRYMDGDRLKEYSLRSTMLALEPLMMKHGLIRCQRSYYVNPLHVKVLRKDKEGVMTAELNHPNAKAIPVSPKYYETLASKL